MYDNLTFPLNVYANLLAFDKQPVDYLHFGLFDGDHLSMGEAQNKSTEILFSYLPPAPAKVLEVGIGLGTTQKILLDKGYLAQGITPDINQIQIAKSRLGEKGQLFCEYFENYQSSDKFDVILFQESSQYIRIDKLFSQLKHLISDQGRIIIIDEVRLNPKTDCGLHYPEEMIGMAKENGMKIRFYRDLSALAKPTMTYIKDKLAQYNNEVLAVLGNDFKQLKELEASTETYLKNYSNGDFGYYLFVFDNQIKQ